MPPSDQEGPQAGYAVSVEAEEPGTVLGAAAVGGGPTAAGVPGNGAGAGPVLQDGAPPNLNGHSTASEPPDEGDGARMTLFEPS
jgi:hypothetical protein